MLRSAAARCAGENQNYACEYDQCSPALKCRLLRDVRLHTFIGAVILIQISAFAASVNALFLTHSAPYTNPQGVCIDNQIRSSLVHHFFTLDLD